MKKILLIDDNADILNPLSLFLTDQGYEVSALLSGDEAVKKARTIKKQNKEIQTIWT